MDIGITENRLSTRIRSLDGMNPFPVAVTIVPPPILPSLGEMTGATL